MKTFHHTTFFAYYKILCFDICSIKTQLSISDFQSRTIKEHEEKIQRKWFVTSDSGFALCAIFIYMSFGDFLFKHSTKPEMDFVKRSGNQFMLNNKPFYINGWNSYWLMDQAVEEYSRPRVRAMLEAGQKMGLTVCRTWAFNDGAYNALQISPGRFDERVFMALDYVIAEARNHGVKLLLSLVNNLQHFGGKAQYVKWASEQGSGLNYSNDSFFSNPSTVNYFKNYVKAVLTRKNLVTGIEYRDEPTIFAWELINEPRCMSVASGNMLQDWIEEMASFVKSVDKNHLLTVGIEGFYGPTTPDKYSMNPGDWASSLGIDFIRNSKISNIDFASVHLYADQWILGQELEDKLTFVKNWMTSHIDDGDKILNKPVLFTEFGLSNKKKNFQPLHREAFYRNVYDIIYESAGKHGAGAGAVAWQFMVQGMEEYSDDYGIIPGEIPSMYQLSTEQSHKLERI